MPRADPTADAALLIRAAALLHASPLRRGSLVVLPARGTLVAAGDLHDNPFHLEALLRLARLDAGPDRHLVLHELIHGEHLVDGADLSHRMLLRMAALIERQPERIHPLLANHEIAQLERRGVSKGAGDSVQRFMDGLIYIYGDEAPQVSDAIDEFIRAMPLALRSEPDSQGRSLFCAHSLPGPAALRHFDADVLNRPLEPRDYKAPSGSAYLMTWGRELDPVHLTGLAQRLGAHLFLLGHRHAETGAELLPPNTVVLNSDHERAAAVRIDLSRVPDAEAALLETIPLRSVAAPQ